MDIPEDMNRFRDVFYISSVGIGLAIWTIHNIVSSIIQCFCQ